jgi:hypothetical protein
MKRYLYIIVLVLTDIGILSAQHSLQSSLNSFRAGDVIFKQQVSYKDPGRTGANVLWDFSQLTIENEEYELLYSSYNDTLVTGTEHLTQYHYALQNDSLLLWGFDNPTTKLHNIQPELLLQFPVNYGDTMQSYYYAHGKYGNRLELDAMGTIETAADSYGMMILPSKDTLKHVLRTRTLKYIAEKTQPISYEYYDKLESPLLISPDSIDQRLANDDVLFVMETFRWYEKGYRYPVFETVRSWEKHRGNENNEENEEVEGNEEVEFLATAFFYPPQEHYYLDDDADNLALLKNEGDEGDENNEIVDPWEGLTYNLYPNPVKNGSLNIEMYLPKNVPAIRVQLRNTMGLIISDKDYGYRPEGTCSFQVDMWNVPIGNYVLDIRLDDHLISEIIMKR